MTFIKYGTVARDPALSGANDHKVELQRNPAQSSWATLAEATGATLQAAGEAGGVSPPPVSP